MLALVGTAGQVCLTFGCERAPASVGSVATLLAFVFSVLGGRLFWGERVDVAKLAGMALVVTAVAGSALTRYQTKETGSR